MCYILHLVNQDKNATLTTMSKRLVKGLEIKISEVELTLKHVKKPISDLGKEEVKVYLAKIREDRYKINNLVDCFPAPKRPRDKSSSSDDAPDTKRQDRHSSWSIVRKDSDKGPNNRTRSLSRHRER